VPTGTARVTTLGELDEAMKSARASKSGAYIEIIGGKMDMPPALAYAHGRLKTMYAIVRSWLQHRTTKALAPVGIGLHHRVCAARGAIPGFWSIVVGNALLATAYGILWAGAADVRRQERLHPRGTDGSGSSLARSLLSMRGRKPERR
jgi:hypothetical protein